MITLTNRPRTGSFSKARTFRSSRPGRAPYEFYPTPSEASRVLSDAGHDVTSSDLIDRGFGTGGQKFLKPDKLLGKHITINPPYGTHGLGDAFVRRALIHVQKTDGTVAMLLNLRSLANPDWHAKFTKRHPLRPTSVMS